MQSRFFHKDYTTSMSYKDTRSSIREFIFSNTELKHYKDIVADSKHYVTPDVLEAFQRKKDEALPSLLAKPPVDEHPEGLNIVSLMKAQWLNHEI